MPWYEKWKRSCRSIQHRSDETPIRAIDNSSIVDSNGALKLSLMEGKDYEIICKGAWDLFEEWYGF
jgi:hypothetical protein